MKTAAMNTSDVTAAAALRELVREVVREELAAEREAKTNGAELLTTTEASVIAKVRPATIREWIAGGVLPARRLGRSLRVSRADLDAALSGPRVRVQDKPLGPKEKARRDHLILVGKPVGKR
jgi:excisionase family DNA binding protein